MSDDEPVTTTPDALTELGKQLPWHRPDAARREVVRSNLLAAVRDGVPGAAPRRWPLVAAGFAAGALAAAAIALLVMRPQHAAAPASYAQIESSSGAELAHTRTPTVTGTDETVRIKSGTLRVAVPAVRTGDHVRVRTADAAVEGTGSYEVTVVRDALASVTVAAGTASVTVTGQERAVFLAAGETWRAPVITADLAVSAPPTPAPTTATPVTRPAPVASVVRASSQPVLPAPPSAPAITAADPPHEAVTAPPPAEAAITATETPRVATPPGPTATERHFQAGTALLRAGKPADAAIELGAAADGGTDALAADARYFQAIALAKAGHPAEAEHALVAFLDHAPTSIRRGRAAVMLARLLLERGDRTSARAWFEAASKDADPAVAAAGRAGLPGARER